LTAVGLTIFPLLESVKWLERHGWCGVIQEKSGE
jgi:hypothetical protein